MEKLITLLIANIIAINIAFSQGAAISATNTTPDPSAILDVSSLSSPYQGVLIPRMNTANRNSIASPATGLHIFNTDCNVDEYYSGTCWVSMGQNLKAPGIISCSGTTVLCANDSRTFSISAVTGATTYIWSVPAGASITSGQGTTSVAVLFGNYSGSIFVTAENACETSPSRSIDIHVNPVPDTPGNITGLTNVNPGDNGISYFIATIQGATLYNWAIPAGCTITSGIGTSNIMIKYPCNATSSNISVTASTNCGASSPSGLAITVNPVLSASAGPAVFGGVVIGGSPTASGGKTPYTYAWSPSTSLSGTAVANPTALCSGSTTTYTVTVTDVNGCTATSSVLVTRNLTANAGTLLTGPGTIGGTPTVTGGQIPYLYSWSPSTGISSTTIANPYSNACTTYTYTVTVTDGNGCTSTNATTVTRNIVANAGSSFSGPGTIGGAPTVTGGKSPYTYLWNTSSGLSSTTIANPYATSCATTTYTITVTDINSCTASNSITVTRNIVASAGSSITGPGTIGGVPTATGGKSPYSYAWSPSSGLSVTTLANPYANACTTTSYSVTVTDVNGCTATSNSITVTRNIVANAGSNLNRISSCDTIGGNPEGSGGAPPYTYAWSPSTGLSSTTVARPQANITTSTAYTVTVTDANGCTATSSMTYTVTPLTFSYTGSIQTFTVPACVTSLTIDAFGAGGGYGSDSHAGTGAEMKGTVSVTPGEVLQILVGGTSVAPTNNGGGGGTFIVRTPYNTLASVLVVAGGGGGSATTALGAAQNAQTVTNGGTSGGAGGTGGNGGAAGSAGGGGGFLTNGSGSTPGIAFVNGGTIAGNGGFGGGSNGSGSSSYGGGGGGYSGGGGGSTQSGGGGGSIINGTTITTSSTGTAQGVNGQVIITY